MFKSLKQRAFIEANKRKGISLHPGQPNMAHQGMPATPHMQQPAVMPAPSVQQGPQMAALHQLGSVPVAPTTPSQQAPRDPAAKQPVFQQQTTSQDDTKNIFNKIRSRLNKSTM